MVLNFYTIVGLLIVMVLGGGLFAATLWRQCIETHESATTDRIGTDSDFQRTRYLLGFGRGQRHRP